MAEPADLLNAWRDVVRQLRSVPALPGQAQVTRALLGPLQRQAELLEQTLSRQVHLERDITRRVLAPFTVVIGALEQTSRAMRTQSEAMQAAAAALQQAGELLELQAGMIETATATLRDPAALLRAGGADREAAGGRGAGQVAPAPAPAKGRARGTGGGRRGASPRKPARRPPKDADAG